MKRNIHPDYVATQVTCTCGNTFVTRSTARTGEIHADVCSNCHPFYTGKQKILDTGGRVARFERRFGKQAGGAATCPSERGCPAGSEGLAGSYHAGSGALPGIRLRVLAAPAAQRCGGRRCGE